MPAGRILSAADTLLPDSPGDDGGSYPCSWVASSASPPCAMDCGFAVVPTQVVVFVLVIAHTYDWLTFGKPSVQTPVVALGCANGMFRPTAMKHSSGWAFASSVPLVVVKPVIGAGCAAACR